MNKTKETILILLILIMPLSADAQKSGNFIQRGLNWAKEMLDSTAVDGLDTAYISLPRYGWLASVSTTFAGIDAKVSGDNIPTYGGVDVDMKSKLSGQACIAFGYCGLSLRYSWDIVHGYNSDFKLSWLDDAWGLEYRRHSTDGMHGTLSSTATDGNLQINEGDVKVKTTILDGYLVFNSKRFSYPAVLSQTLLQRRSAGSLIALGTYIYSSMTTDKADVQKRLGGMKEIEVYQFAVGLGYGYNYAAYNGRLLIHASAFPMAVIHNNSFVTLDYTSTSSDGSNYETEISKKLKMKHKVSFTGLVRFAAYYNVRERLFFGVNGLLNDIRFKSSSNLSIRLDDWLATATVGVRF